MVNEIENSGDSSASSAAESGMVLGDTDSQFCTDASDRARDRAALLMG